MRGPTMLEAAMGVAVIEVDRGVGRGPERNAWATGEG